METIKEFRNILKGQKIEVFTNHRNITYETIESASHRIHHLKSPMQEFGVNLLYIKGEANVVANDFIQIPMVHHSHKLEYTTL